MSQRIELCDAMVDAVRALDASGLNQGTSGNISVRSGTDMLITPSAVPSAQLTRDMIVAMPLDADAPAKTGRAPSSEWRLHLELLRARADVGAIVHTHSPYATALSITRQPLPACHYMIVAFGGDTVRCADYATFGTPELSATVLAAMTGREACLMANHGMVVQGRDLSQALWRAHELENLARLYQLALGIGPPVLLDAAQTAAAHARFHSYLPT